MLKGLGGEPSGLELKEMVIRVLAFGGGGTASIVLTGEAMKSLCSSSSSNLAIGKEEEALLNKVVVVAVANAREGEKEGMGDRTDSRSRTCIALLDTIHGVADAAAPGSALDCRCYRLAPSARRAICKVPNPCRPSWRTALYQLN